MFCVCDGGLGIGGGGLDVVFCVCVLVVVVRSGVFRRVDVWLLRWRNGRES